MSVYQVSVFLHILGALGLFAGIGIEWASLANLRRASTSAQVGEWTRLLRTVRKVEGPAALVILVSGIYLGVRWGEEAWIGLGLLGLVLIGVVGGVLTGRRAAAIERSIPNEAGPIPDSLQRRIDDPVLRLSARLRLAIALGVVFLMSVKPEAPVALAAMGGALALGLILAVPGWRSGRRRSAVTSQPVGS